MLRNDELVELCNKYGYDAGLLERFQKTILGAEGDTVPVPGGLYFALFTETRPDLLPENASINLKFHCF